ncbi:unnamed protein product [Oppiella nova]|uniref:Uncharacterized protein n=1 Tax=Oppiella nova TaxID=334625 RepID=A0A7R9LMR0_9ACAR|nr:unnamed protein product [Oppiella nova]CAG2165186.1 unnamed protein product [Oppiella nova]
MYINFKSKTKLSIAVCVRLLQILPLPWFLYTLIFGTVTVNSKGMICSVILLFLMLMFVILTIALFKWSLNIGMAIVMFILYSFETIEYNTEYIKQ